MPKLKKMDPVDAAPVAGDGVLAIQMTPLELARLQLHQARVQMQLNMIENLKMKQEFLAIRYRQDHAVLQGQIKGADDSRAEAAADYSAQLAAVEERLGIKMADYVVDDVTGVLRKASDLAGE